MVNVFLPLHEQREYPMKSIRIRLKKGVMLEELEWDEKTEDVKIFDRLVLKGFKWDNNGRRDKLTMVFKRVDLDREDGIKADLIDRIIEKHFERLKHSFLRETINEMSLRIASGSLSESEVKELMRVERDGDGEPSKKVHEAEEGVEGKHR